MKRVFIFLLLLILPFAFSSCDEETPTEQHELVITHISCLDQNNNDLEEINYTISQSDYVFKNVKIYAYYSDGSSGDVTPFVTFSEIDLTTVGEKKVEVIYKEFKDSLIVKVIKNEVSRIEIDKSKVNLLYKENDYFDLKSLIVYKTMSSGELIEIKDYKYSISYEDGNIISGNKLTKPGKYIIQIEYENKFDSFEIYVYKSSFNNPIHFNTTDLLFDDFGKCNIKENHILFTNDSLEISTFGNTCLEKFNENGTDFEFIFADQYFDNRIKISPESGLILDVKYDFELVILKDSFGSIDIKNTLNESITYFEYSEENFIHVKLTKGLYKITALTETIVNAMLFDVSIYKEYKEINVDTNNVKLNFNINDEFNYHGLKISYIFYDGTKQLISLDDCDIYLMKNGKVVNSFNETGLYDVVINFMDFNGQIITISYIINVNNNEIINELELDLSNVKVNFGQGENFNYNGLVVYYVFGEEKIKLNNDDYEIKLYYIDKNNNEFSVTDFLLTEGKYYVEVLYNKSGASLHKTYDIEYNLNIKTYSVNADVKIKYDGDDVTINVELLLETVVDMKFFIYDGNDIIYAFSSFNSLIDVLDSNKTYTIKGHYTGRIGNDLYIVNLKETIINFNE